MSTSPSTGTLRLQAVDWSKAKISAFKKAYSEGEIDSMVMSNFLTSRSEGLRSLSGLGLLSVPVLEPTHFHFMGNRPYQMQVVSNGECFGLLSHEKVPPKRRLDPAINIARMEVITTANLPFLQVSKPTEKQVRLMYADLLAWTVAGFRQASQNMPEEVREFCRDLSRPTGHEADPKRFAIEQGQDPREVLADWIQASTAPVLPRSRLR